MNKDNFENTTSIGIYSFKYQNIKGKFKKKLMNELNCECKTSVY